AWLDVLHQLDVHDGAFIRALTREGRLQSRITATERGDHVTGDGWKLTDWLGVYAASPSKTYTITFDTAAMKARYTPYYTEALK
ncbi:hypothetical protein KBZ21_38925, partial [Streptomyces sp. A73]|nr:hypothetical protein [Streptomyces sp. A73]